MVLLWEARSHATRLFHAVAEQCELAQIHSCVCAGLAAGTCVADVQQLCYYSCLSRGNKSVCRLSEGQRHPAGHCLQPQGLVVLMLRTCSRCEELQTVTCESRHVVHYMHEAGLAHQCHHPAHSLHSWLQHRVRLRSGSGTVNLAGPHSQSM